MNCPTCCFYFILFLFFLAFIDCQRRVRTLSDPTHCKLSLLPSVGFSSCSCRTTKHLFIGIESKYLLTCPHQSSQTFWLLLGSGAAPFTSLHTHWGNFSSATYLRRRSSRADSPFCCNNGKIECVSPVIPPLNCVAILSIQWKLQPSLLLLPFIFEKSRKQKEKPN